MVADWIGGSFGEAVKQSAAFPVDRLLSENADGSF
jgi:hypothetical protein